MGDEDTRKRAEQVFAVFVAKHDAGEEVAFENLEHPRRLTSGREQSPKQ